VACISSLEFGVLVTRKHQKTGKPWTWGYIQPQTNQSGLFSHFSVWMISWLIIRNATHLPTITLKKSED
jgi:hypothetical protein